MLLRQSIRVNEHRVGDGHGRDIPRNLLRVIVDRILQEFEDLHGLEVSRLGELRTTVAEQPCMVW